MGSLCLGPVVQCFEKWSSCGRRKAFTLDHLNEIAWLTVDPWQKPSMSHRSTPRFVRRGVGLARQLAVFVSSRQTIPLGSLAQSPMWKKKRMNKKRKRDQNTKKGKAEKPGDWKIRKPEKTASSNEAVKQCLKKQLTTTRRQR